MKHTLTHNENGVAHLHIHIPAFESASEAEATVHIQAQVNQAIADTLAQDPLRLWSQPMIADIETHAEGTEVSVLLHHFPPFALDLSQISVPVPEVPVITNEHLEQRLRQYAIHAAAREVVQRPAQWDDLLCISLYGSYQQVILPTSLNPELWVYLEPKALPDFPPEALLGIQTGETRRISVPIPADYPVLDWRNQAATWQVTARVVYALPGFDPAPPAEDAPERETIRQELRAETQVDWHQQLRNRVIQAVSEAYPLQVPKALAENQLRHLWSQQEQPLLAALGITDSAQSWSGWAIHPSLQEQAELQLQQTLLLSAIAGYQGLDISPEEIDQALQTMTDADTDLADMREALAEDGGLEALTVQLRLEKVSQWLCEQVSYTLPGEDPDTPAFVGSYPELLAYVQ